MAPQEYAQRVIFRVFELMLKGSISIAHLSRIYMKKLLIVKGTLKGTFWLFTLTSKSFYLVAELDECHEHGEHEAANEDVEDTSHMTQ